MPRLAEVAAGSARCQSFQFSTPVPAVEAAPQPQRAKRRFAALRLTAAERQAICAAYGPVVSLDEAARIAGLSPATLKRQVCEGSYANCVKRGKPLRFLTDRFAQELFGRSDK